MGDERSDLNVPQLKRSISRRLKDGSIRAWPGSDDYAQWFVEQGVLAQSSDLLGAVELHGQLSLDWVRRGQTGCKFAAVLASKANRAAWQTIVLPHRLPDGALGAMTNTLLAESDGHAELVQLIFPYIQAAEDLVELVNDLCSAPEWYWESIPNDQQDDDSTLLGLRWLLPFGDHVSWTVGFAPFDFVPFTRRAPFVVVQVRVNRFKRTTNDQDSNGFLPVHLADADDLLPSDESRRRLNESTKAAKANNLNGELVNAARARVTFRLPREYVADLCPEGYGVS